MTSSTRRVEISIATRDDDAGLRRLLRDHSMPGQISLSLEREPDYFADANLPGEEKQTIVARDGSQVIGAGHCVIRNRFVNGRPCRVGYLGGLRLQRSYAGRFDLVRRGYELFRELQQEAAADFCFTSIAADNERARRFLERGISAMPRYEFVSEFVTLLLPAARRSPSQRVQAPLAAPLGHELLVHLNQHNREYQFAPCWSGAEWPALERLGLRADDFLVERKNERIVACAALWDQRSFKQSVIRGYAPWLGLARPALNLAALVTGGPHLPAVGRVVSNALVTHLAVAQDHPELLLALLAGLRHLAASRGIELLTLGFADGDPRLAALRGKFRWREYRSRIYVLHWPGVGGAARELDGRLLAPEVALL